jgi:hypothetical protein
VKKNCQIKENEKYIKEIARKNRKRGKRKHERKKNDVQIHIILTFWNN